MVKISKTETGNHLRRLLKEYGLTVRDVQEKLELDSPQAVYKWLKGQALPTLDNLLTLGSMLELPVEQLLVLDGEEEREVVERRRRWEEKRLLISPDICWRTVYKNLECFQMMSWERMKKRLPGPDRAPGEGDSGLGK